MGDQSVGITLSFDQANTGFRSMLEQELVGVEIKKLDVGAPLKEGTTRRVRSAVGEVITVIGVVLSAAQLAASLYQILREQSRTTNRDTNVTITTNTRTTIVRSDMDVETVTEKILEIVEKTEDPN